MSSSSGGLEDWACPRSDSPKPSSSGRGPERSMARRLRVAVEVGDRGLPALELGLDDAARPRGQPADRAARAGLVDALDLPRLGRHAEHVDLDRALRPREQLAR